MSPSKPHRHRYKLSAYSGKDLTYRCSGCGARVNLDVSRDQTWKKLYQQQWKAATKDTTAVHRVWHSFCKKFKDSATEQYLYKGAEFITRVHLWAKRRSGVKLLHVDDAYHAGSLLVLIEHRTAQTYMGLTVVMISQCAPFPPVEFFLYPYDANALYKALSPALYRKDTTWKRREYPEQRALRKRADELFRLRRRTRA